MYSELRQPIKCVKIKFYRRQSNKVVKLIKNILLAVYKDLVIII